MQTQYGQYKDAVEQALRDHPLLCGDWATTPLAQPAITVHGEIPQPLRSAMRYSLSLPGKRLRPVLLLASYHVLKSDWQSVLPYAVALEMIHTYSLIHDDLPALDDDDLRRGQPSNHKVFGENIAVLAGDALYSLAFETMLSAALAWPQPKLALAAMEEIARRAGVRGMIAGQTLDVKLEQTEPSARMVKYIHRHKTTDLITAPVVAGLMLAGAEETQIRAGEAYGQCLGMAFQIVDDLLDVQGDTQTLGKQTGMDAQRGKMTWPSVYGVEIARADARRCVDEAVRALAPFGESSAFLTTLARDSLSRVT